MVRARSSTGPVVELIEVSDEWHVRTISRQGHETVYTFPRESFAVSFARERCRQLGLEQFDRI